MIQAENSLHKGLFSMLAGMLNGDPQVSDGKGEFAEQLASLLEGQEGEELLQQLQLLLPEVANAQTGGASVINQESLEGEAAEQQLLQLLAAIRFRQNGSDGQPLPLGDGQSLPADEANRVDRASLALALEQLRAATDDGTAPIAGSIVGNPQASQSPRSLLEGIPAPTPLPVASSEDRGKRASELVRPNALSEAVSGQLRTTSPSEGMPDLSFGERLSAQQASDNKLDPRAQLFSMVRQTSDDALQSSNRQPSGVDAATAALNAATSTTVSQDRSTSVDAPRLPVPAGHAQFANALGERVRIMVSRGVGSAVIRLDPPHLGSLEIHMRSEGENTKVQFIAQGPAAREAIEQALPRLRESFADNGSRLEASVSERDEQTAQNRGGQGDGNNNEAHAPPDPNYRMVDDDNDTDQGSEGRNLRSRGLLDAYA